MAIADFPGGSNPSWRLALAGMSLVAISALADVPPVPPKAAAPSAGAEAAGATGPALQANAIEAGGRNVYASGGKVRPSAPVEGDYMAVGGQITLDQAVKGDATLAGGSVDVRAAVGDDVRVVGGDISIESSVGGELFATGGNITLTRSARVANAAALFGGAVTVDGMVVGPLKVRAQKIVLNGEVEGDANLAAEQIELGPTAKIVGALTYSAQTELKRAEGASVLGAIQQVPARAQGMGGRAERGWRGPMDRQGPAGWWRSLAAYVSLLAFAALLLLVFPGFSMNASQRVQTAPGLSLVIGLGALVGVPALAVLLFITLVGIPIGIAVLAIYPLLVLTGYLLGVNCIGRLAQSALRKQATPSYAAGVGFFALALLVVMLLGRVPFVGPAVIGIITLLGAGAMLRELFERRGKGAVPPSSSAGVGSSGTGGLGGTGGAHGTGGMTPAGALGAQG